MDSGLKKRLLGAFVLIALAVIFVPMLLPGGSGAGGEAVSMKIPPQPSGEMQTRILQVGPGIASAGSSTAAALRDPDRVATVEIARRSTASGVPPSAAATSTVVSAPTPAPGSAPVVQPPSSVKVATVAAATPEASASARAAPASTSGLLPGGPGAAAGAVYTVNLGIYADRASADRLVADAKKHGFTAAATAETFQGKPVMRVRVGPYSSRGAAEAARLQLKGFERVSMTIDTTVLNQRGDAPRSAIAAGEPGTWAVQLGAFSVENQANALRDRLRAQGFDGYVDGIDTAKGKLWRVRAGPFASRDVATATRGEIAQKMKIKGDVVTQ